MTEKIPPQLLENLQVLYEDNHLIAVNKPAGVLVQGDRTGDISLLDIVKEYIKKKYQKPGNVFLALLHRLDRPVSGIVLFAKTSKGASRLSQQIRSRTISKIYLARVEGVMHLKKGDLHSFIKKGLKTVQIIKKEETGSQSALLSYRTIKKRKDTSLLEIQLHTGRKHQIRAQLSAAGCPIVGDKKYGASYTLKDQSIHLFAKSLTFSHPTKKEIITIQALTPYWC